MFDTAIASQAINGDTYVQGFWILIASSSMAITMDTTSGYTDDAQQQVFIDALDSDAKVHFCTSGTCTEEHDMNDLYKTPLIDQVTYLPMPRMSTTITCPVGDSGMASVWQFAYQTSDRDQIALAQSFICGSSTVTPTCPWSACRADDCSACAPDWML